MRFKRKTVKINKRKVSYWEKHHSEKRVIIFLHGFPGSHKGIVQMAYKIGKHCLIIPDLPGCGQSDPLEEKHTLKNYSKWLNDFLKSLSIDKAVIVGHSFGARVALMFGVYYPNRVERLVLITPVAKVDSLIGRLATLNYAITEFLPIYLRDAWLHNIIYRDVRNIIIYKSASKKRKQLLIASGDKEAKKINLRANIEVFDEFYKHKSIAEGEKIHLKTLIIASDKDEVATLKSIKELFKRFDNADLKIMKNSGHLVVLERPKLTGKIISLWLK